MNRTVLFLAAKLSFAGAVVCTAIAQTGPLASPALNKSYAAHIAEAAQRFDLPATWIRAVLWAESSGDPRAVSSAGAIGLMQIMPATWNELRVRHRLSADPFDPRDNILAGAAYLRELFERYGNVTAMLAAYNAGPRRYEASLAGKQLPPETRAYIAALAPLIDNGAAGGPLSILRPSAQGWRNSPLFAVQPERSNLTEAASLTPQPRDLFVAPFPAWRVP